MSLTESLFAALFVSAIPTLFMWMVVARSQNDKKDNFSHLDAMVAFAAGALLADATHHIGDVKNILYSIALFFIVDVLLCHHTHEHSGDGILALMGDAVHNFTDGIAISAAMSDSKRGLKTILAITLHEIPHQFADYAILFRSGYSLADIIKSQAFTALACFLGVFVGTIGSYLDEELLESFTSGGFLYLSLSTLIPSIKETKKNPITIITCFIMGIFLINAA
jgi:zinc transporter ZupT